MRTALEDAMYRLPREYPGGVEKLAELAGMNAGTLYNKTNPGMDGHKLAVTESVTLQYIAKDYRVLCAEAAALQHVAIPLADFSLVSDVELLDSYTRLNKELGDMAAAIADAFRDRRVSRTELAAILRESDEAVQAMFELRARLEAIVDD